MKKKLLLSIKTKKTESPLATFPHLLRDVIQFGRMIIVDTHQVFWRVFLPPMIRLALVTRIFVLPQVVWHMEH